MKEKVLIRYIRKSKTVMVSTISRSADLEVNDEVIYRKERVYYPCGVLVCVCRTDIIGGEKHRRLYFGWSYISSMAREKNIPSFVKKTAIKIAMDKVNGRRKLWTKDDMPIAIRREFDSFMERAVKYFKTDKLGNYTYSIERIENEESVNTLAG